MAILSLYFVQTNNVCCIKLQCIKIQIYKSDNYERQTVRRGLKFNQNK